ncbi:ribosome maturation factor RimP [Thermus scotoductus]|uniref:Ribosome maturation factor RimP n=1 Tax=Thermus scotoductus TaxID=37636 RepID=A0A430UHB4_THESC|nr:ribosome maturation factor RimP [Thermus scotoductus]RTG95138.1 ribosome maturation factor RimP [Thermus scotoductus]RTG96016.1 ribosome maturation factor RimP [Thermus scotoductus]RTH04482.1 ribosome maturation factor RimP [Thermus scotoductus]RTH04703.1 ribosome maturation factor RimP [Thermus scotoductus]
MPVDLWRLVEEAVEPLDLEVLEVKEAPGEVLVRLERKDERPIRVADLERASRAIEAVFDQEDPIPGSYRLLVESPGPKRPLFTRRHFERFQGLKAKVPGPEGFTGRILRVEGDEVVFQVGQEEKRLRIGTFRANLAEWPEEPR